jgi:hypothetical protein
MLLMIKSKNIISYEYTIRDISMADMSAFGGLGILLFCYTLYSLYTGEVYAKDRHTGRTILKNEEPFGY